MFQKVFMKVLKYQRIHTSSKFSYTKYMIKRMITLIEFAVIRRFLLPIFFMAIGADSIDHKAALLMIVVARP